MVVTFTTKTEKARRADEIAAHGSFHGPAFNHVACQGRDWPPVQWAGSGASSSLERERRQKLKRSLLSCCNVNDWVSGNCTRAAATVASIGNSRPPRSTRTASCTLAGRPKSKISLRAARMLRPVCSTSSSSRMWEPSTAKGKEVCSARLNPLCAKSSRCRAVEMIPT